MKILKSLVASSILLTILFTPAFGQNTHKGLPLLKANSNKVDVRVGKVLVNNLWTIRPEYNPNSLHIQVNGQKERLVFYTDIDSAVYEVRPAKAEHFYVLLNKDKYVFAEVRGFKKEIPATKVKLLDIDKPRSKVFGTLWEKHQIGDVVNGINTYAEKASSAVNWAKGILGSD